MDLTPEQKKALEEQKANCVFCKIVKGEIPSKKVFEDEQVLAILDINPATKGHVLLLPKEHYPILPLIPREIFTHLFKITHTITEALAKAMLTTGATLFIANGQAAGQQSPHFLFHLVPREADDGLEKFALLSKEIPEEETKKLQAPLIRSMSFLLATHFKKYPAKWHHAKKEEPAQKLTVEQVVSLVNKNPQLKAFILEDPEEFKKLIPQNDQLKALFQHVSVDEVLLLLGVKQKKEKKSQNPETETDVNLDSIGDLL
ncbi:HIT domain-containing protein [Candidatus Woesearchaeota archaeon]|nr:HIT domain-containing protein [Candidatus Woesearchaeota archaeon]